MIKKSAKKPAPLVVKSGFVKDGVFHLKKTLMVEYADGTHLYRATRSEVRKAFEGADQVLYKTRKKGPKWLAHIVHEPDDLRISIGCQSFFGADYIRLRRWAKGVK